MKIIVHDYSGHPFQVQLSRQLARQGHDVRHQYCDSYTSGKGALALRPDDPAGFAIEPISMDGAFARYSPLKRIAQEVRYGLRVCRNLRATKPNVILMCNVPLLAHSVVSLAMSKSGLPVVFWQQDVYSSAIGSHARRRLGPALGSLVSWAADVTERQVARSSASVVAISGTFLEVLNRWQIPADLVQVIPNWAAIEEMPVRSRDNAWGRSHDLVGRHSVIYSGTLGLKHDPQLFVHLAKALLESDPEARVVVVSEGQGREHLENEQQKWRLPNLVLLNYQAYEDLPNVLASADVLVSVLEPDAGSYSVPSKVLNYLCAGRPILGVMPVHNEAATTLAMSQAGVVVPPADYDGAVAELLDILGSADRQAAMGAAGRRYAEAVFDIEEIGIQFEAVLTAAAGDHLERQPSYSLSQVLSSKEKA